MANRPDHVPSELFWDNSFDAYTKHGSDPFAAATRLHDGPLLIWASDAAYGRPGWIATRHALIDEILADHEKFSAERPGMIGEMIGQPLKLNPIEIDPPDHHAYRRNLNPAFAPKVVRDLEDSVRATCRMLLDDFGDKGRCDFIADFAIPFPTYVFLDLMALPRDMAPTFLKWEEDLMRGSSPASRVWAAKAIFDYLCKHKEGQLGAPSNAVNRAIVEGEFAGRPLDHLEMLGMYYVLWVGGLDTVYSTLGWVMHHLATHPELQERLRAAPALISQAVEEFTRAFPVVVTHRRVARDTTFHGIAMRAGEEVHLPLVLANRDPARFADPQHVDIDRKPRHIAFGTGAHNCLGVHLAKREIRIVLEEFLARCSAIRLASEAPLDFHTGRTFGIDSLPLRWESLPR
jgi:cytochrome P450